MVCLTHFDPREWLINHDLVHLVYTLRYSGNLINTPILDPWIYSTGQSHLTLLIMQRKIAPKEVGYYIDFQNQRLRLEVGMEIHESGSRQLQYFHMWIKTAMWRLQVNYW